MSAERPDSLRGFSLAELLLTLLVLSAVVLGVLFVIDRNTRLLPEPPRASDLDSRLAAALRLVTRDVEAAAQPGRAGNAVLPVADNTRGAPDTYRDPSGRLVAVRAGTDQLGLRGLVRGSRLALEPGAARALRESLRATPAAVPLVLRPGDTRLLEEVRASLEEKPGVKRFVAVYDDSSFALARAARSPAGSDAGALRLDLDFTDADAASRNPPGSGNGTALGAPVAVGVFDELVWFVARGAEARAADSGVADPPSLATPHPYLAVARWAGADRWEVTGVSEEIEDFQVAWGLAGPDGAVLWRGREPGSAAPAPSELVDATGASRLVEIRIGATIKSARRLTRADGPPPPEAPRLFNAPAPGESPGLSPVGWAEDPRRAVWFARSSRTAVVALPARRAP